MIPKLLKVPNTSIMNIWFKFISDTLNLDFKQGETLYFDFNIINFLDTNKLVLLACLIEQLKKNYNLEIVFMGGTEVLNAHLDNIKFKKYWIKDFNRDKYTVSNNHSTLCLWHICTTMIDGYGQQAQKYFMKTAPEKNLQPLSSNLAEVFNNIFNHSKSEIDGYVLTQFFPKTNELSFSVCDFGVGIARSVNDYLASESKKTLSDSEAIQKSLKKGFSIKSIPQNAGLGLNNVLCFTENSDGKLTIYSNSARISKRSGITIEERSITNFNGTLINVRVNVDSLDEFDPEDAIYEF